MATEQLFLLAIAITIVAFLYSCVGHAGASGYIAVMSLFSFGPDIIKPTALILNILVATIASYQFWKAGHFSWRLFWPFAVLSIPMAFIGGSLKIPVYVFKVVVGIVLLASAVRFLFDPKSDFVRHEPSIPTSMGVGGALGFLAGLTGTGGGIFLTPVLLLNRWALAKTAASVSAMFILVNSISGLLGNLNATRTLPAIALLIAAAAVTGGTVGSYVGSNRFSSTAIKRVLAVVLIVAGLKLILT